MTEFDVDRRFYPELFSDVTTILARGSAFEDVARDLLRVICDAIGCATGAVWLVREGAAHCEYFWHIPGVHVEDFERATRELSFTAGQGLPGRVLADGQAVWTSEVTLDPNFVRVAAAGQSGLRSAIAFPILSGREVLGVFEFCGTTTRSADDNLLEILGYIGSQIGLFLSREQTERALRDSERRYRILFEKNVAGVYRTTPEGKIVEVNEAFARIFGYGSPEEVLNRSSVDLYANAEDRTRFLAALRDGNVTNREALGRRKDGSTVWILLTVGAATRDETGQIALHGTVVDISKRKAAEDALARMTADFNRAQELASIGSFVEDLQTGAVTWSDEMYRIAGMEPQSRRLDIDSVKALIVPEDRERVRAAVMESATKRELIDVTYHINRIDGERRLVRMLGEVEFRGSDGAPARLVGTVQDITEERRLNEDRERLHQQVEQVRRVSSLGQLAASMAHEFNNVLMGIQPHVEVIRRQATTTPVVDRAVHHIIESVRRGSRITEEILTFTRPVVPELRPVAVRELLDRLESVKLPNIQLRIERPPNDLWILGDAAQLDQVMTNLVLNARDAMPNGGSLVVSAKQTRELSNTPAVVITVSDTGSGMPPEVREHIFEPLFTTKRRSGTGLGLAITYQIIVAHGGTITVSSEVGKGTTFRIALQETEELATTLETAPRHVDLPNVKRVLLVEDDTSVSSGIAAMLEGYGLIVHVIAAGSNAGRGVDNFKPDAVILDIGLPDVSGWDVYADLRRRFPRLPIVISSGHAVESEALREDHSAAILRKPYPIETLLDTLREVSRTGLD